MPADAVLFSRDYDGYRIIYVATSEAKEAVTLPVPRNDVPEDVARERFAGYILANVELLRRFDIPDGSAIVEVEVNGGRGSPAGADRFAATKLRRLDGSAEYPFSAGTALAQIFEMCAKHQLARIVKDAAKEMFASGLGRSIPPEISESSVQLHATWNSSAERIEAACLIEGSAAEHLGGQGTQSTQEPPKSSDRVWGLTAVVSAGLLFTVSKSGEIAANGTLPLSRNMRQIRAPPVPSGASPIR